MPLRLERRGQPITSVETWFQHAPPLGRDLHWRDGRSAKELAKAWCPAGHPAEPPAELVDLLATVPALADLTFDRGFPEHRVRFDRARGEPRNTDLAVACSGLLGPVGLSIEAKADESFGSTIGHEIVNAASQWAFDERVNKLDRIRLLVDSILPRQLPGQSPIGELRYQVLTAIAGAWAFAQEVEAPTAVLVVHEFVSQAANPGLLERNARDLDRMLERVTTSATSRIAPGHVVGPLPVPGGEAWQGVTQWYLGKCRSLI